MTYTVLILAYLLGSIPFGLLLVRYAGMGDIRKVGSGNIGATNVMRTGNKKLAIATLLCDLFKGTAAVLLANWLAPEMILPAAMAAMLGHIFPIWLKFKGGKGVATFIGVLLGLSPAIAALVMLIWIGTFLLTRYSSVSSLAISLAAPPLALWLLSSDAALWMILMGMLIIARHRGNIDRLLHGEEPKFTRGSNA